MKVVCNHMMTYGSFQLSGISVKIAWPLTFLFTRCDTCTHITIATKGRVTCRTVTERHYSLQR